MLPMIKKLTTIKDEIRVCVELDDETSLRVLDYPKYIISVLIEAGFSYVYESIISGIEFVHNMDIDLRVILILDHNANWYHQVIYKHSKWTLTYEGDIEYHVFGNDVLKTIRSAYLRGEGL